MRASRRLRSLPVLLIAGSVLAIAAAGALASGSGLTGKTWHLTALAGKKPLAGTSISAVFGSDGKLSGSSGCNHYSTAYKVSGNKITISSKIAATQKACPRGVSLQEAAYLKALTSAKTYGVKGTALTLFGASGKVLATYVVQSQALAGTSWNVLAYNNGKQAVVSVIIGVKLTADFGKDGKLGGFAGCNDYTGSYTATAPKISISQLASTRKFCGSPTGVMEQEDAFLAALQTAATYKIDGSTMELRTASRARSPSSSSGTSSPGAAVRGSARLLLLGLVVAAGWVAPAGAAADPAAELAQKYAPVVRLVAQQAPCGDGEPYQPIDVNPVLGNDEVALRGPWATSGIVKVAPTAKDLSAGLFDYYLDFPGNPLSAGCTYEEWSQRMSAVSVPTTYARVVGDPAYPGQVALQYWFFYVYNDYNNKHEGDWEMIQLDFAAPDAQHALAVNPAEVGYSQHDGAERAHWGDSKLEIVGGTHPVVYPAAGSHANYYQPALYLGRSAAQGVGCDDTVGPSRQLRPKVAVVPTDQAAYLAAFPWLGYEGHWGEQQPGFYNGPTGPNTKDQWTAPITWADATWRDTSFAVPAGGSVGHAATDFFCGAVAAGSNLLTAIVNDPGPIIFVLLGIGFFLIWLASRTRWDVSAPFRLRRRRPWGSIITSAWHMYGRRRGLYLGVGLLFIPLGVVITGVQYLVFRVGLASLVDAVGASNGFVAALALGLGLLLTLLGLTIVQAVTALAMVELDQERPIGARGAYRLARRRLRPLVGGLLRAAVLIAVLDLTVVGIPLAIWLTVRWSLLAQVIVLEDQPARGALRRSGKLVHGHWPRTASLVLLVTGTGLLLGPLIGTLMLLLTSASFNVVNLIAGLIYTVALPFVAIATTYLYFDLLTRERLAPAQPTLAPVLPAEI